MPRRLHRYYGSGYLHFITSSCYQRRPLLNTPRRRTWFLELLEQVRRRYTCVVVGDVIMPEHFHLLISEPERGNPSTVMQVLKQRFARKVLRDWRKRSERGQNRLWEDALNEGHVWQRRFFYFLGWGGGKRGGKVGYMHPNPGQRGLGLQAGEGGWGRFWYYYYGGTRAALVYEQRPPPL